MRKLSRNYYTSASMKDWCMSCRHTVSRDTRTKVHEICGIGIGFDWPDPCRGQIPLRSDKNVRNIRCEKKLLPGKVRRSSPQVTRFVTVDRPHTSFYRRSVVTGSRLLRFRDIAGLLSQMPLVHTTVVFYPKFADVSLQLDRYEQCSVVRQFPGLISRDVILGEH